MRLSPTRQPEGRAILAQPAALPAAARVLAGARLAAALATALLVTAGCSHNARDRAAVATAAIDMRTARPMARERVGAIVAADSAAPAARLSIPEASVVRRGALAGVYVVEDGRARLRWLRLGRVQGGQAEVLAGLWPTDEVALEPGRLTDGQPVRVSR